MAGQRKLQQEMDRVFKKITEGLEVFDTLYERHENISSQSQKDKLESELKKEIKKLQRFREQVKNWQAVNEIKDKDKLLEFRRLVEVAMEKYKIVEKGSKTKAYSDQSLANLDEPEAENEAIEFVRNSLDNLRQQGETLECDLEKLASTKKGRRNIANEERKKEIEETLSVHHWHVEKLEIILRLLQNDVLNSDEVMNISEDVKYYLEDNQDPDFINDDTIYDDLDLEADQVIANEVHVNLDETIPPNIPSPKKKESTSSPTPPRTPPSTNLSTSSATVTLQLETQSQQQGKTRDQQQVSKLPPPSLTASASVCKSIESPLLTEEKPQVIHPFAIGTSSTNQPTMTTLKPAPVPNIPAGEMKWSAAVIAAKKKESSPTPPPNSVNMNMNALNAASVLEALKKQKPKDGFTVSVSPALPSVSTTPAPAISSVSLPTGNKINTFATSNPTATTAMNSSLTSMSSANKFKVPENKQLGLTTSQYEASNDPEFRFLPPGIQSFILSISLSRDVPNVSYKPLQTTQLTPKGTYPSGLEAVRSSELWNRTCHSTDLVNTARALDSGTLFYGYYFAPSVYERTAAKELLIERGWREQKGSEKWFLKKSETRAQGEGWNIADYGIFDVNKWSVGEKKNLRVENSWFI